MNLRCTWVYGEEEQWYMDYVPRVLRDVYLENPQVLIYGMALGRMAVGAAVVQVLETEAVLRFIFVEPEYRRAGLCSECLSQLGFDLWEVGVAKLTVRYVPGEHEEFHGRMEAHGAHFSPTGGGAFRFTLADAKKSPDLAGSVKGAEPLAACSQPELLRLGSRLKKQGTDLVPLPIEPSDYEADCSCVYKKGGEIRALLLVKREEDAVDIPLLYSDAGSPAVLLVLMRFAFGQGCARFPDDTMCTLRSLDQGMTKLLERLLGRSAEAEIEAKLSFSDYDEYHRQFMERLMLHPLEEEGNYG